MSVAKDAAGRPRKKRTQYEGELEAELAAARDEARAIRNKNCPHDPMDADSCHECTDWNAQQWYDAWVSLSERFAKAWNDKAKAEAEVEQLRQDKDTLAELHLQAEEQLLAERKANRSALEAAREDFEAIVGMAPDGWAKRYAAAALARIQEML